MSNIFKIKPYERTVYYYETDRMGIVHHSNYIRWFEEARDDFMIQIGCPYKELEDDGIMIPVLSVSSTYKKAFVYGDTFMVNIIPKAFNGIKFLMEYEVRNKENDEIYAQGQSTHCFVDNNMRPILLKKQNPELFDLLDGYFMSNKLTQKDK